MLIDLQCIAMCLFCLPGASKAATIPAFYLSKDTRIRNDAPLLTQKPGKSQATPQSSLLENIWWNEREIERSVVGAIFWVVVGRNKMSIIAKMWQFRIEPRQ